MIKFNLQQLIRMNNDNKWGALSMKDRAFLIRQAVKNGITDIGSIKDTWEHRFDGTKDNIPTEDKVSESYIQNFPYVRTYLEWPHQTEDDIQYRRQHFKYSPDFISQVQSGDYILSKMSNFSKNDSLVYTPLLERLDTYFKNRYDKEYNGQAPSEQEKVNQRYATWMIANMLEKKANPYNENHKFINDKLTSLSDDEIDKLFNVTYYGPKASLIQGLKAKPKNTTIPELIKMYKIMNREYFHEKSDYNPLHQFSGEEDTAESLMKMALTSKKDRFTYPGQEIVYYRNRQQAIEDINQRLVRVENAKTRKGGWDKARGVWEPHKSFEGGNKTIGYGLKLVPQSEVKKVVDKQGFLTENQEKYFRTQNAKKSYAKAKDIYESKYGEGSFDDLHYKVQSLLTDKEYNVRKGLKGWPSLMEAVHNSDISSIKNNIVTRGRNPKTKKLEVLKGRNDDFLKDIDSLEMGIYPIKLGNHSYSGETSNPSESVSLWDKLYKAYSEGARMARDARIGNPGAQMVRDLYDSGEKQKALDLAKSMIKANSAGIALGAGAASSNLLTDLLTTAGTTVIDTIGDGDSKNLAKNVAKNAIGDLLGFGAGKALNHFIDLDIIEKAFKDGRLRIGEPTTYTAYHQSDNPITQFTFPYKQRWDVVTHGADPNAAFFTVDNPAASGFLSKRPYTSKFDVTVQRPLIQTGEINGTTKNSMRNKIVKHARKLGADGVLFDDIADNQLQNQRILMAFDNSDIKFGGGPGKVRYFGPTMGKTTFVKANPDYIDLDSYIKNTRIKAAELLGLEVSDPRVSQSPIYKDAFRNRIIEFQTNNTNKGKTLLGSQRQLLSGDFVLDDTPLLPDFATFVERNQSRGFRETPEQLRSWYNGILKLKPDIKIDNRYISDIISSEF